MVALLQYYLSLCTSVCVMILSACIIIACEDLEHSAWHISALYIASIVSLAKYLN